MRLTLVVLMAATENIVVHGVPQISLFSSAPLELLQFWVPVSSASAAMTALALNAGSKKAAEWFYLSDLSKSEAARTIKAFEDTIRISLSSTKTPFFCSTILYLQGAAFALERYASRSIAQPSAGIEMGSVSSTVSSLLGSYPAAAGYEGYCIQLFPSPSWRSADSPCEGTAAFPDGLAVPGIALYSLKCLAASDFDWRTISSGYRPGGVSALSANLATVVSFSNAPDCSQRQNSDAVANIAGMLTQLLFIPLMVGPVSAMLTMGVKDVCNGGFVEDNCLRFENVVDLFF